MDNSDAPLLTPDRRYLVVRGRLWRAADPGLSAQRRAALTRELMDARRGVGAALRAGEANALRAARAAVDRAKRALGERGAPWWDDGAPDYNRRLARNTPYAQWYAGISGPAASSAPPKRSASPGRPRRRPAGA